MSAALIFLTSREVVAMEGLAVTGVSAEVCNYDDVLYFGAVA